MKILILETLQMILQTSKVLSIRVLEAFSLLTSYRESIAIAFFSKT